MTELIALFDMDDTLCDYIGQLKRDLSEFFEDPTPIIQDLYARKVSPDAKARIREIRNRPGWWANLPRLEGGIKLWQLTKDMGFSNCILTKGPYHCDNAYTEKRQWQKRELPDTKIFTITDDKSLVDGTILIDDFPPYLASWLNKHPSKLGIMPERAYNIEFKNPRTINYTVQNLDEIKERLKKDIIFK